MLKISVMLSEGFDDEKQEFVSLESVDLELEHSLVSVSKWEAIFEKPFLGTEEKSQEETLAYFECMCLTPNIPRKTFLKLSPEDVKKINNYIGAKMTATWFSDKSSGTKSRETITTELIYYWMIALNVPFECENWHINRLLTLIRVCNEKNAPKKRNKMGKAEMAQKQRDLNEQRRRQYGTTG